MAGPFPGLSSAAAEVFLSLAELGDGDIRLELRDQGRAEEALGARRRIAGWPAVVARLQAVSTALPADPSLQTSRPSSPAFRSRARPATGSRAARCRLPGSGGRRDTWRRTGAGSLFRRVGMKQVGAQTRRAAIGGHDDHRLDTPVEGDSRFLRGGRVHWVAVFQEEPMRDAVEAGVVTGKRNLLGAGLAEERGQPVPLEVIGKEAIRGRDVLGAVIGRWPPSACARLPSCALPCPPQSLAFRRCSDGAGERSGRNRFSRRARRPACR